MKEKVFIFILLFCASFINLSAQNVAVVKSFTRTNDHIPGDKRRNDLNKNPCALVKVMVSDDIERIESNSIGDVVKKGNFEKWVYMCKGSRNMRIHLKNHLPVKVMFKDYQINGLESNRVYELIIETSDSPNQLEKQKLIINYTPVHAMVLIDSKPYSGNGRIETELPVGEHNYTIAANGYVTAQSTVKLNKDAPREITERLSKEVNGSDSEQPVAPVSPAEPSSNVIVGATGNLLTLKVNPFFAKIKIDGKAYDADGDGELTVPLLFGMHQIEVEAEGYKSENVTVNIKTKKSGINKKIKLSELEESGSVKLKKGMVLMTGENGIEAGKNGNVLILEPTPTDGIRLFVDGIEYKPNSNVKVKSLVFNLPYGAHEVKADCDGYVSTGFTVNIGQSKVTRKVKLKKIKTKKGEFVTPNNTGNTIIPGQNGNDLELVVKPVFASIFIDGNPYSADEKGRLMLDLPYGMHKIDVEANGYFKEQTTVVIGKKSTKKVVKLKKISKKKNK